MVEGALVELEWRRLVVLSPVIHSLSCRTASAPPAGDQCAELVFYDAFRGTLVVADV